MRIVKRAACFGSLMLQLSGFTCLAQAVPELQPADPKTFTIPPLGEILPQLREAPTDAFSKMRRKMGSVGQFDFFRQPTRPVPGPGQPSEGVRRAASGGADPGRERVQDAADPPHPGRRSDA